MYLREQTIWQWTVVCWKSIKRRTIQILLADLITEAGIKKKQFSHLSVQLNILVFIDSEHFSHDNFPDGGNYLCQWYTIALLSRWKYYTFSAIKQIIVQTIACAYDQALHYCQSEVVCILPCKSGILKIYEFFLNH